MPLNIYTEIQYLKGVGPESAKKLKNLGIETIGNLLTLVPRRYVQKSLIKDLIPDTEAQVCGRIIDTGIKRTHSGEIFVVKISDGTGYLKCSFFNYSRKARTQFKYDAPISVEGQVSWWGSELQIVNPSISLSPAEEASLPERFLPIYPLTANITHKYIRKIVRRALDANLPIPETLPDYIITGEKLLPRKDMIYNLHFPETLEMADKALKRIEFEEVFWLQILLALRRKKVKNKGIEFKKGSIFARKFLNILTSEKPDFKLTTSQIKVSREIFNDMEKQRKMNRLLQGDVGSGKTIIAIFSILKAVESGYQTVFMAPTEILAEQHWLYLNQYFSSLGITINLLVGSMKESEKKKAREEIENGITQVIVGTHALIEGNVKFKNLGFVVIDEQHRFGVEQRSKLVEKGHYPDILVLTATPIPRSLALTLYGDLDLSVITEMPPGVPPVQTRWVQENGLPEVWNFVKSEIDQQKQAYIVYPLIEESEKQDLKAAEEAYKQLSTGVFKDYKVGLLHGRMKGSQKDAVMHDFRDGKINVLVATTVIEVGINVPNASCMVIQHSERFGLAQLHQLRGRLHRGTKKSYCILVSYGGLSDIARERLNAIVNENDGFKLAEKDLELRGPGEFLGIRQHGLPEVKVANLMDTKMLARIRELAFAIIDKDPDFRAPENQIISRTLMQEYRDKLKFLEAG